MYVCMYVWIEYLHGMCKYVDIHISTYIYTNTLYAHIYYTYKTSPANTNKSCRILKYFFLAFTRRQPWNYDLLGVEKKTKKKFKKDLSQRRVVENLHTYPNTCVCYLTSIYMYENCLHSSSNIALTWKLRLLTLLLCCCRRCHSFFMHI